jgi:hypothetical protein
MAPGSKYIQKNQRAEVIRRGRSQHQVCTVHCRRRRLLSIPRKWNLRPAVLRTNRLRGWTQGDGQPRKCIYASKRPKSHILFATRESRHDDIPTHHEYRGRPSTDHNTYTRKKNRIHTRACTLRARTCALTHSRTGSCSHSHEPTHASTRASSLYPRIHSRAPMLAQITPPRTLQACLDRGGDPSRTHAHARTHVRTHALTNAHSTRQALLACLDRGGDPNLPHQITGRGPVDLALECGAAGALRVLLARGGRPLAGPCARPGCSGLLRFVSMRRNAGREGEGYSVMYSP